MRDFLNWDSFITEDEDPAYAGDKVPNSPDDIPCGDGWISKDKDCHDGEAHRPEPGENPYWTDENSADERNERDVDWDDNKPSEPAPEEPGPSAEAIELVPEGQWARQKDMVAQALESLQAVLVRTPKGNTKAIKLKEAAQALQSDDRAENLKAVEALQAAANEALEFISNEDIPPSKRGGNYFKKKVDKAQFAVDQFNSSIKADDPRDIQTWDKVQNRPETLEVEDLLQLSNFDMDAIPDSGRDLAYRKITKMKELLASWRESPTLGGADLARMFVDDPDAPVTLQNLLRMRMGQQIDPVERSPFETNTKLAMAILDRSARVGDESANRMLWESFGLSESWTPNSYLHDHRKAAEKATTEMKQWADWSGIDAAQRAYMLAGSALAEAEYASEEFEKEYQTRKADILKRRDSKSLETGEFAKLVSDLEDDKDAIDQLGRNAHMGVLRASEKILKEAEKIRQPIKNAMRKVNQYTQIDAESAGEILHNVGNAAWAEINEKDEDYTVAKGKGIAGLTGKKLLVLRQKHRDQISKETLEESSRYPNSAKIQESLQDLFSIAHRDVVGGPGMVGITWESEVMVRAYASSSDGRICLSVGADLKKVPKHEMWDTTRKYSGGSASDRDDIAIHEFAHHMEFSNPDTARRFSGFYKNRTEGQPLVRNGDIDPKTGQPYPDLRHYDKNEEFIPDHFFSVYCGKSYGDREGHGELVSMGVQAFYNEHMWGAMVRDDPEHMALIIATLRGY